MHVAHRRQRELGAGIVARQGGGEGGAGRMQGSDLSVLDLQRVEAGAGPDHDLPVIVDAVFEPDIAEIVVPIGQRGDAGLVAAPLVLARRRLSAATGKTNDRGGGGELSRLHEKAPAALVLHAAHVVSPDWMLVPFHLRESRPRGQRCLPMMIIRFGNDQCVQADSRRRAAK